MVPEGWSKKTVGECIKFEGGTQPPKSVFQFQPGSGLVRLIQTRDFKTDKFATYIPENLAKNRFKESDIMIGRYGPPVFQIYRGMSGAYNVALVKAVPKNGMDRDYAYYFLKNDKLYRELDSLSRRSAGQAGVEMDFLKNYPLSLPPLSEQKKIAEILSTWDKAIETTEKLLVNAEAQKLALMQQLLTGKRRMKGFVAPWRTCHLADVAQIIVSNVDKKSAEGERSVRLCNYMDVYSNETVDPSLPLMQATATPAQIAKFGLRVGDVLITKDSETPEDIAVPAYVSVTADDLVCGYHLAIIRPRAGVLGRFLKFYFEHPHTRYYFASRANGATRFGLTIASIEEAPINLPGPEEQERIADAIAAAEVEVKRALEAIEFLRSEKRALMQQLLTGKRRVTV